jgi:hypothetical protein
MINLLLKKLKELICYPKLHLTFTWQESNTNARPLQPLNNRLVQLNYYGPGYGPTA